MASAQTCPFHSYVRANSLAEPRAYRERSFFVLPGLLSEREVDALAARVDNYVVSSEQEPATTLLRARPFGDRSGGWYASDFPSDARLRPLFDAVNTKRRLNDALGAVWGGGHRALARRDLYVDYSIGWHNDWPGRAATATHALTGAWQRKGGKLPSAWMRALRPKAGDSFASQAHYQDDPEYGIATVAVYLQDHRDDDDALTLIPRAKNIGGSTKCCKTMPTAAEERKLGAVTLRVCKGDVVVFDSRVMHRGVPPPAENEPDRRRNRELNASAPHRTLFTLNYGRRHSLYSEIYDEFFAERNALFNERCLCGGAISELRSNASRQKVAWAEQHSWSTDKCGADHASLSWSRWAERRQPDASLQHSLATRPAPPPSYVPEIPMGHAAGLVVLVVGASSGVGLEAATALAAAGAKVHVTVRDASASGELCRAGVTAHSLDVRDDAQAAALARELSAKGVVLDVLLHVAGTNRGSYAEQHATNARAPFAVADALLPAMTAARGGGGGRRPRACIVTSIFGTERQREARRCDATARGASTGLCAYIQTKLEANQRFKTWEPAWRQRGVTAVALHPGWVATQMTGFRGDISAGEAGRGIASVCTGASRRQSGQWFDWRGRALDWNSALDYYTKP